MLAFSKIQNSIVRNDKGFKTNTGEGRIHGHIKLKGVNANVLDVKVSGSDTDGDLAVFEQTSLRQGTGFAKRKNDRNHGACRKTGKFFCNHGCIGS